jgi:radical SAM superfamily enzyme YgiQ (UPF0313 family)
VQTRADHVDRDMLVRLKEAGCYLIAYGIETGSSLLLGKMGKGNDIESASNAITLSKEIGISVTAYIIVGNVGETAESIANTVSFLKKVNPDAIGSLGELRVFPGTKLYELCKSKGFIEDSFWLSDEPYKIYTLEHSLKELAVFQRKVFGYKGWFRRKILSKFCLAN